ncbi:AAA family ATPase [Chamaesiphon sp. VAR_48_metabat_135_sub]|uniref:stress-responsive protein Ycf46 n=1 Tax=Chamaesiphon sp. VAR_48_metabat_135_sub TaxID=2964699 RepID=UPI00286B6366|nr:AAA family ATPase [Chamaesiphon sp. VAR_48_metabat_135_sub]
MQEELNILIQAQYPLIYLVTAEEDRAGKEIAKIAQNKQHPRKLYIWTQNSGMVEYERDRSNESNTTLAPEAAIAWTTRYSEPAIFVFKDLHPFKDAAGVTRWLRDAIAMFQGTQKVIILMSPVQEIPIELEKEVVVLDFALPNLTALDRVLTKQLEATRQNRLSSEGREKLLKASLGLTQDEAEKVYRKAYVKRGKITEAEVDIVLSEKKQLIRRNGILEFIEEDETIDAVGGLDELKGWLVQRSNAFTERAREYGLPQPKGMLILGVPGCGKSLIAKTTARLWGLPLLRLDMGRVYDGSTVGRSEANLRGALKTAESISPAILFIDELDKAFAGSSGSADSDGGTSSRIFGSFLTWMQEKTSPIFVMATANRVERLPGEFLRKGRFDEIFFVDLPTQSEREAVFKIHLSKRNRDLNRFDLLQLSKVADGFSGAEIEQALIAAMYDAFAQNREFTQLDIIAAIKATLPLSRTMSEQVTALRDWARQRARPAAASVAEYHRLEF